MRGLGWLVAAVLVAVSGCGSQATVTGTVTYKGRPVTYGSVTFVSVNNTARSGVIYSDGSYTVEGVEPGDVKIGIVSHDPRKGRSIVHHNKPVRRPKRGKAPPKSAPPADWFPLPRTWENPNTSGLVCTLPAGCTQHDLDLK